jgi:hypothetical protein
MVVKNIEGRPIDIISLINSGDFPLTFISGVPYERFFIPASTGKIQIIEVCLEAMPAVERRDINVE